MTIEDAVRLTLAAASLPQNGYALYVLEMGEAVRIFDLAIEMIRRAGKRPFVDVDINIVGVRPGEKLHEELSYPWEHLSPTAIPGVRSATPAFDPRSRLRDIDELMAAAQARDCEWVRRALVQIVPEYAPGGNLDRASGSARRGFASSRGQKMRMLDQKRRSRSHPQPAAAIP